jgi:threonine dehydrogenase-like Zn-dependent dehydrogenase
MNPSIQLIASGAVDVNGFISAKYPLTDAAAAFEEYERNPSRILRLVIDSQG